MLSRLCLALALFACPATAFPATIGDAPAGGGNALPVVARGASLDIHCAWIGRSTSDVRVVMYPNSGDTSSGVAGVLVTERRVTRGNVQLRVPDIPELKNHVVRMKVYYFDSDGRHTCDGGQYHLL